MPLVPLKDRFHEAYSPEPMSGCWLWLHLLDRDGYGRIWTCKKKETPAHRWAYQTLVGEIPDGLRVLHRCDTPSCVNPDHLFLGTQRDNMRDMVNKGRLGGNGKRLTPEIHQAIAASTLSRNATARQFNVRPSTVTKIKKRLERESTRTAASFSADAGTSPEVLYTAPN